MKQSGFGFVMEIGILAIGCVGIGYGLKCRKQLNELSDKIDKSIDEIEKGTIIDVSEDIVEKAVNDAVAKKTSDAVNKCVSRVIVDVDKDLHNQVKNAVTKKYESMEASVTREIEKQIKEIDIDSVKDEVIVKAKEAASEKFNDSLDDVLNEFKERLNSITKVYKSIEDAIGSKASGDKAIKLVV